MKLLYLDCFAGVAGDMLLGALVDLGGDLAAVERAVRGLGVGNFSVRSEPVRRGGIGGVQVHVSVTGDQPERHLAEIEAILGRGTLAPAVRDRALRVFRRLTEAEARVHRAPVERVHLHEVGALDAIVDVVGTCVLLDALGVEAVRCSPVALGSGLTRGAHGPIPIPGPATLELLRGAPVRPGPVESELTTPTGAALVATLADRFGPLPDLTVERIGYGAGSREHAEVPNLLRAVLGSEAAAGDMEQRGTAMLLEASLDDLSPQVLAWASERLLAAGALDVWTAPVVMKKGRPGHVLSVLAPEALADKLGEVLFLETSTLGVRMARVERRMLERRIDQVETAHGRVRVKVALRAGAVVHAAPEYEDCAAAAARSGVPLKQVQAAALLAWRESAAAGGGARAGW